MHRSSTAAIDHDRRRILTAAIMPATAIAIMWIVLAFDEVYGLHLSRWGIYPRSLEGLRGVVFSPFIHGGVDHLANNSLPLLVLGWFTVYFYPKASGRVVLVSWLVSGLWVWVMGRESYHIGASSIVYALAGFTFFSGVIRHQRTLMAVSLIVVFLYGSMWWGVLPLQPHVSWEGHLAGGLVGSLMAWLYRKVPPAHVPPPPAEEDEDDEGDEFPMRGQDAPSATPEPGPYTHYDPSKTNITYPW